MEKFDVIVWWWSGSLSCSLLRASQLGLNGSYLKKSILEVFALNWGCIPTKALLKSAGIITKIKHARRIWYFSTKNRF